MTKPFRIVDAHHHLWDLSARQRYPWLMEKGRVRFFGDPSPIQCDYLTEDFRKDIGELPVVASIHIQVGVAPGDELAETYWLQEQHRQTGLPSAIIAYCDMTAPNLAAKLDAHQKAPGLRGIRQIIGRSAEEDKRTGSALLLDNPNFLAGLKCLAERKLTFDLQLMPTQMERAAELLSQVPNLHVALCHAGSLNDPSPEGMAQWKQGVVQLSKLPNLICKLSGFGMFNKRWSSQSIKAQFETVLDVFGPERIAFGSNFPVDKLALSYAEVWDRYFELTKELRSEALNSVFHDTAARFYRIADSD